MTSGSDHPGSTPWQWDPTLYEGTAAHYARGRAPYPAALADTVATALGLDGDGTLLDIGCGPGSLTLLLAPHFAAVIGVDPDPGMLAEAARIARERRIGHVVWRQLRAEQLPADLPRPHVVTFAQSFHWMDRPRVAAAVRAMVRPGGVVVHVGAQTHEGMQGVAPQALPRPPRAEIDRLVRQYLGPVRRAGRGLLPAGTPGGEDEIFRAAGFTGPERRTVPGWTVERSAEQIVSSVHSLSSAAPHLFGDRLERFDEQLLALLANAAPEGLFGEQLPEATLSIWR